MKKVGYLIISLILISLFFTPQVTAKILNSDNAVSVLESETIDDDLFISGGTVTIDGIVNGDVYAAGGNILIDGTINGDVIAGGGVIQISGSIRDDVRLAGGTITFQGAQVGDSVTVVGGSLTIDAASSINGGLTIGVGSGLLRSTVGRSFIGGGGSILLDGAVNKDVLLAGESLTLGPSARVQGNVEYTSKADLIRNETAVVNGSVTKMEPNVEQIENDAKQAWKDFFIGFKLWSFASTFIVGLALLFLFKPFVHQMKDIIRANPLQTSGWGLVVFICAPVITVFLLVTVFGIPLALILLFTYMLLVYLSQVFVSVALGQWAVESLQWGKQNDYIIFLVGLLIYSVLTIVPVFNVIVWCAAVLLTLGAFLQWYRASRS